jgi:hypothetical protein
MLCKTEHLANVGEVKEMWCKHKHAHSLKMILCSWLKTVSEGNCDTLVSNVTGSVLERCGSNPTTGTGIFLYTAIFRRPLIHLFSNSCQKFSAGYKVGWSMKHASSFTSRPPVFS